MSTLISCWFYRWAERQRPWMYCELCAASSSERHYKGQRRTRFHIPRCSVRRMTDACAIWWTGRYCPSGLWLCLNESDQRTALLLRSPTRKVTGVDMKHDKTISIKTIMKWVISQNEMLMRQADEALHNSREKKTTFPHITTETTR